MKIAIIGCGMVGLALAKRWRDAGHEVSFAVRNVTSDSVRKARAVTGDTIPFVKDQEAVRPAEVVVLATQFRDAEAAIKGAVFLDGKILLDATNPVLPDLSGLAVQGTDSAAERIAGWAKGARVVKAFNTTGFNIMEDPLFPAGRPAMFVCGDDAAAKTTAIKLAAEIGFDGIDAGPLVEARLLEPLAMLWIKLAYARGLGRDIAFSVLRR